VGGARFRLGDVRESVQRGTFGTKGTRATILRKKKTDPANKRERGGSPTEQKIHGKRRRSILILRSYIHVHSLAEGTTITIIGDPQDR